MFCKFVVFLYLLLVFTNANLQQDRKDILDVLLATEQYDPQIKPTVGNNSDTPTTVVSINLHVLSVSQIDDKKMLYTLELYFRQEWKDERLEYDDDDKTLDYITLNDQHRIWVPDIYFVNEYKSYFHDIMESNSFIKIHPDGTVSTSARITLVLRCPMNFVRFPFDKQTCPMVIESYKWKADDILLKWKNSNPVSVADEILEPLFSLENFWTEDETVEVENAEYSVLKLKFEFVRQWKYYLIQVYVPCCMIFVVSCLAFWMNTKLMTARILLGTTTLFVMAILVANVNKDFPMVAYTKAIDVFTGIAMTFTFCSLIESVVVHVFESRIRSVENKGESNKDDVEQNEKIFVKRKTMLKMKKWLFENHKSLNDIDAACRVLFPICFMIFIIIYGVTCVSLNNS